MAEAQCNLEEEIDRCDKQWRGRLIEMIEDQVVRLFITGRLYLMDRLLVLIYRGECSITYTISELETARETQLEGIEGKTKREFVELMLVLMK